MPKKRKRSYGAGELVSPRKPGGTWAIRVRNADGTRHYRGGFPTRELAERVMAKVQADTTADRFGLPIPRERGLTLGQYAGAFFERRKATHSAHKQDAGRWKNHLSPVFGHLRPDDVNAGLMRDFIEGKIREGLASGTVRILVAILSSLYADLIEDGLTAANPTRGLPRKTRRLMKPSHDPRTTPFIEKIADMERIYRDLPEPMNVGYALGALAGLRTGEVFALRWRHVDLATRRIHVRESIKGPLKDKESRIVPIMGGLLPVLTSWALKGGRDGDRRVVPPLSKGTDHVTKNQPGKYIRQTLERLGLAREGLGWYEATRHTFASQWVLNGGSIEKLKEILGHYSVVITERYAHLRVDLFSAQDLSRIPLDFGIGEGQLVSLEERRPAAGQLLGNFRPTHGQST